MNITSTAENFQPEIFFSHMLTHSTEQRPSWRANSHSATSRNFPLYIKRPEDPLPATDPHIEPYYSYPSPYILFLQDSF